MLHDSLARNRTPIARPPPYRAYACCTYTAAFPHSFFEILNSVDASVAGDEEEVSG